MNVFISSTCYDLIDLRSELEDFFRQSGLIPVLSDSLSSEFQVLPDRNSIDATAIDSTVLEMLLAREPAITERIRTITVLGPSPAPPWVVHPSVPASVRHALIEAFLSMDQDPRGQRILKDAGMLRFAAVSDRDYDSIREMERVASSLAKK